MRSFVARNVAAWSVGDGFEALENGRMRTLIQGLRDVLRDFERRFVEFGAKMDRKGRAGDFGKWPWQKDYGLWPWQRRRKGET